MSFIEVRLFCSVPHLSRKCSFWQLVVSATRWIGWEKEREGATDWVKSLAMKRNDSSPLSSEHDCTNRIGLVVWNGRILDGLGSVGRWVVSGGPRAVLVSSSSSSFSSWAVGNGALHPLQISRMPIRSASNENYAIFGNTLVSGSIRNTHTHTKTVFLFLIKFKQNERFIFKLFLPLPKTICSFKSVSLISWTKNTFRINLIIWFPFLLLSCLRALFPPKARLVPRP